MEKEGEVDEKGEEEEEEKKERGKKLDLRMWFRYTDKETNSQQFTPLH